MSYIQFVVGGLGDGKSMYAVCKLRDYLAAGKKVATNYNIDMEALCSPGNKHTRLIRVPDSPSQADLRAIGLGSDVTGDKHNGLLLLDELGTWFNARDFANKDRQKVLNYIIHLRKKRWDVVFIVQDFSMVDKQLRGKMTTYLTTCLSSHKSLWFFKLFPEFHMAVTRNKDRVKVATDFRTKSESKKMYPVYDHEQLFNTPEHTPEDIEFGDPALIAKEKSDMEKNGLYCVLPPGYTLPAAKVEELKKKPREPFRISYTSIAGLLAAAYLVNFFWGGSEEAVAAERVVQAQAVETRAAPGAYVAPGAVVAAVDVDPFLARFQGYRIASHTRFGNRVDYVFQDSTGARISQAQLLQEGFRVISRGPSEVTIMQPGQRYITLTEFLSLPPVIEQSIPENPVAPSW